jgi:hypothetical protein
MEGDVEMRNRIDDLVDPRIVADLQRGWDETGGSVPLRTVTDA